MSDDETELVDPHHVIRTSRSGGPVWVIADTEGWRARERRPETRACEPLFVVAGREPESRWRVLTDGVVMPRNARDLLAQE
ncbi:DUF5954 family protein [Streptomyces specialis]|uniref:DUF5954 family protein n=1 Tax=Streptomyces specialis TaxID=498367 RepID=UPI00131B7E3D|nr:DUF5954 family protein [Streptomyces specialis]